MKKQTAYIFAAFIVVLIILAIVIMWLTGGIGGDKPEATPTPEVETSAPRQTQFVIPTATPQPTEAVPTETPTMTATPTPTPEAPSGTVIGSGSFDSSTGRRPEHPHRVDGSRAGRRQRQAHAVGVCALVHAGDRSALDRDKRKRRDLRRLDAIFQRRFPELADRYTHLHLFDDCSEGQCRFRQRRLELQGPVQRPGSRCDLIVLNDFLAPLKTRGWRFERRGGRRSSALRCYQGCWGR